MKKYYIGSLLATLITLIGCSDDELHKRITITVEGRIEKGPFRTGAKVYLYELDDPKNLNSIRNEHTTTVLDDNGTYRFEDIDVQATYLFILADGNFYNEVTGKKSSASIQQQAIVPAATQVKANINVITTLRQDLLRSLIESGLSYDKAVQESQETVMKQFGLQAYADKDATRISLTDGSNEAASLIVISSTFMQKTGWYEGGTTTILYNLAAQLEQNGAFNPEDVSELRALSHRLDLDEITDNMKEHYGEEITIKPLQNYIDWDSDGIAGNEWENGGEMLAFETDLLTTDKDGEIFVIRIDALTGYNFLKYEEPTSTPYTRMVTSPVDFEYEIIGDHTIRIVVQPSCNAFMLPGKITIESLNGNHSATLVIAQEPDLTKEGKDPHELGSQVYNMYMNYLSDAFNRSMVAEAVYTHAIEPPVSEFSWMQVYENDLNASGMVPFMIWKEYQDAILNLEGWKEYLAEEDFYDETPYAGIANMQAFLYYHMALFWENISYMPSLSDGWTKQLNSKELFAILEKDILKAIELFPEEKNRNLIFNSKNFPRGLLANMYLLNEQYEKALPLYEAIIQSNQYNVNRQWYNLFQPDCDDHILAFPKNYTPVSEGDYGHMDWISEGPYMPLMTYSEILLCAAECELHLGNQAKAMEYISEMTFLAQRSSLLPATPRDVLLVLDGIWRDRLAGTLTYFAFLKRNDLATEMLGIEEFRRQWPIPANPMATYPWLMQNPGY